MGRGAILCTSTRPNEVGVGPIYPYSIAAATGLKSKRKFVNPLTRIEAIVIFDIPGTKNGCFCCPEENRKKKGKQKVEGEKRVRAGLRPAIEFHNISASLS